MLITLIIQIYIFLPVSVQKSVFSVLVIWIKRDEQVECRCAFKEKGMTEVYYKGKPWKKILVHNIQQFHTIRLCHSFFFFFLFRYPGQVRIWCIFCVFCAGINVVEFITLLESVEKSFFSVTVLLLLLILFYYSVHFL